MPDPTIQSILDTAECWSEDGDVLYCSRERYTRGQAKAIYANEVGEWFPNVRCRRVWMRQTTEPHCEWGMDFYLECPRDKAEFECWRVELR